MTLRQSFVSKRVLELLIAMMITSPAFPLVALAATVVPYVRGVSLPTAETVARTERPPLQPAVGSIVGQAVIIGAVTWFAVGGLASLVGGVDRANHGVYREILTRVNALESDLRVITNARTPDNFEIDSSAWQQLQAHLRDLSSDLQRPFGEESQT